MIAARAPAVRGRIVAVALLLCAQPAAGLSAQRSAY